MSFFADAADNVGTLFNLPDWGISESLAKGNATPNTGRVGYTNGSAYGLGTNQSQGYFNSAMAQTSKSQNDVKTAPNSAIGGNTGTAIAPAGGSGVNYAALNANAINQLNQSAGLVNNSLGRLDGQLGIARDNINTTFNQRDNELNSQRAANENSYNTSTTQNGQNFRSNKNTINDQASSGLRGLMRMLGAYGAVGSDMGLAGQAVSDQASQQNAGAGQTFAQNQQSLDTNWGNYKNASDNEKKKLSDWKTTETRNAEAQSQTTRQDLLSKLADINGQISAARGGSYAASAQPYLDQANALSGSIDGLARINPTYTGNTPQYTAASLDSYQTGNGTAGSMDVSGGVAVGLNTPYLNMLLGRDDRQKQLLGY